MGTNNGENRQQQQQIPCGDDNKERATARATATADPFGMTIKGTDKGNGGTTAAGVGVV
jgi:hypothetical protein